MTAMTSVGRVDTDLDFLEGRHLWLRHERIYGAVQVELGAQRGYRLPRGPDISLAVSNRWKIEIRMGHTPDESHCTWVFALHNVRWDSQDCGAQPSTSTQQFIVQLTSFASAFHIHMPEQ